jgi:hypothetical protein
MPDADRTGPRHLALLIICPTGESSASNHAEGGERMVSGMIFCTMTTDDQGWPLVQFEPDDVNLQSVAAFLQSDVDILLPTCDELLAGMQSVRAGRTNEWSWNGDRFLVRVGKERATMLDKYADAGLESPTATIDTDLLSVIVTGWRRFVSTLQRQRKLATERAG